MGKKKLKRTLVKTQTGARNAIVGPLVGNTGMVYPGLQAYHGRSTKQIIGPAGGLKNSFLVCVERQKLSLNVTF